MLLLICTLIAVLSASSRVTYNLVCEVVAYPFAANNCLLSNVAVGIVVNKPEPSTLKRVAIASFEFEGNDFSQKVNGRELFVPNAAGEAIWPEIDGHKLAVTGAAEVLRDSGQVELVPILVAQSQSGAKVEDTFYQETFNSIVERIRAAGKLDGVYLALHGAMVSGGVRDAEGDLLTEVRNIVGEDVPIAASLDLHGHVTQRMLAAADILVAYANYPHDDAYDTGRRAGTLLRDTLNGSLRPVMRAVRMNMVVPVTGSCTREHEAPLAKVQRLARSLEVGSVVSTSYFTVQPWLDDDDASTVALAISNGNDVAAEKVANRIAFEMWNLRDEFELPLYDTKSAVQIARDTSVKPVIFADQADGVGAGSGGDAALVLEALIENARDLKCAVSLVDPVVAEMAHLAGIGALLDTTIGHRCDSRYGAPIGINAKVVSLNSGDFTYSGGPMGGVTFSTGPTAVLQVGEIQVLVASLPSYDFAGEQYAAAGIDISKFDIVVFKNQMNFRTVLKADSTWMLIDGVGSSSANLAKLPWKNRVTPFWPRERSLKSPFKA